MKRLSKTKAALLAAASVVAASVALSPAAASDMDAAAYPATYVVEAPPVAHAAGHVDEQKPGAVGKWALIAGMAGALAGLVKLIGARRVAEAVSTGAVQGARAAGKVASAGVRAVGRAAASPLRMLGVLFGLTLFALTGAGLYDLEWVLGLLTGAAGAGFAAFGLWKTRRALRPAKLNKPEPRVMDNGI